MSKNNDEIWFYSIIFTIFSVFIAGFSAIFAKEMPNIIEYERALLFIGAVSFVVAFIILKNFSKPLYKRNELLDFTLKETLHELNIPIATIKANAQMLKKEIFDDKNLKRIERIELATTKLLERYRELEYYIREEIGNIELETFEADKIIEEIVAEFDEIKGNAEILLELEPTILEIDKIGFERVVRNLIQNSIKYSKSDSKIDIKLKNGILEVSDNGEGMDEITKLKALELYYQGPHKKGGFGIGLSFIGNFCANYNLGLRIESKKGVGTKVTINFSSCHKM